VSTILIGSCASLASAAAWGLSAVLYQSLEERVTPFGLNLARGLLGLILLYCVATASGFVVPHGRTLLILTMSGILGIALGDSFFFLAIKQIGARLTALLSTLSPLITVFFSIIFLGERVTIFDFFGIVLTVTGIGVVLWEKNLSSGKEVVRNLWSGVGYGALAMCCMSASVVMAKVGVAHVSAIEATVIRMAAGILCLIVWGLRSRTLSEAFQPLRSLSALKMLMLVVVVSTFGGFLLFMASLKYIDASLASTLNCTTPLFVLPFAAIFFKERISGRAVAGAILAVCGAGLVIGM
jgi:drug/metabolite transporter (DMT)-like permease